MSNFDPAAPLPRRTVQMVIATGAGQASPGRLLLVLAAALVVAGYLFLFTSTWWLSAWPTCVAAFCMWGLSMRATYLLDIRHDPSPSRRLLLRLVRVVAITVGVASASVALTILLGQTLGWEWALDVAG